MTGLLVRGAMALVEGAWVRVDVAARDGVLAAPDELDADAQEVDATALLVAPGYIDLQCNGGLGIDLAREPERLWDLAAVLPRFGVTAWLPTIVSSPEETTRRALAALAAGPRVGWHGAIPEGLHLEGPFLSPAKRGAHPEALLQPVTLEASDGWSRSQGVAVVTLAPDLPGVIPVIEALVQRGVIVSLGHSPATAEEATTAVEAGATWVTHLFNAMAPLHHREPGLVGVALTDERLHVGLIPDGIHVHPQVVALAQQALGGRLTIVTDAVAALGTSSVDGVRLPDGTLAGSNLAMDQGVRNLLAFTGCRPEVALHAASTAPAAVLRDPIRGTLAHGARADLVVLTEDLHVVATVVAGRVVHDAR